jgi:acetolactate synthase regulatory subunit
MDFQIGIHRGLFVCLIVVHRSSETLTNQLNPMIDF